jgi:CRP-like cAMP-binding protein
MVELQILKKLVPLNGLADHLVRRLGQSLALERLPAQTLLCEEGTREDQAIYLIDGSVELTSRASTMRRVLSAAAADAAYPLASGTPRQATVRATTPVTVLRIDKGRLERLNVFERFTTIITTIQPVGEDDDTTVAVPPQDDEPLPVPLSEAAAFAHLPRPQVGLLIEKMKLVAVRAGEAVVRQGQPNDYFYLIDNGRFVVSQKDAAGKVSMLGELTRGMTFGEDSLLTGAPSPTTVVAMGPGHLRRLSKQHFDEFLRRPPGRPLT